MEENEKTEIFNNLKHKQYGVYGNHSAVEICEWNKKALRGENVCYKQKFYNVDTHRCAQITPAVIWCHFNCIFCWRPTKFMKTEKIDTKIDKPKEIIEGLFKERIKLLSGFGGNQKVTKKYFEEAKIPSHVAISLSGEPMIYPYINEMVLYLKSKKEIKSIFIVTNGMEYEKLKDMNEKNALPIQLYLSIEASNKDMHFKINRPKIKNSWEIINKTIDYFKDIKTRRVLRYTLIKGVNDSDKDLNDFIDIFERSDTDFLEIKAYMHIGESRMNLDKENMPYFEDILKYSEKIEKNSEKFKIEDSFKPSRIVLLKNKNSKYKNFIKE